MGALDYATAAAEEQDEAVGLRGWLALATGLNLAFFACWLLCKPPDAQTLSWASRLLTALFDLGVACLFGAFGTWLVLPDESRGYLRSLLLCGARGWVFLPAIALGLKQESLWAPFLTLVTTALIATYLSRFLLQERDSEASRSQHTVEEMFRVEIALAPASWVPLGVSCCLYGAFLAALADRTLLETALLAVGTLLLVLKFDVQRRGEHHQSQEFDQRSRLSALATVGFCCIVLALSASSAASDVNFLRWSRGFFGPKVAQPPSVSDHATSGYHTIVLWPLRKKEKTIIAPPLQRGGASSGLPKPWTIPFDGPYWYFQFAAESLGPNARTTQGDPLKVNVRSTDNGTLLMEAHQHLTEPLDLSCCREIQIVFKNDVSLGAFAVGLTLTDSRAKGVRSESLGVRFIDSSAAHPSASGTSPVEQVLSFPFPRHRLIRSFDAITVSLLPDARHRTAGRRVALERFILIPN